MYDSMRTITDDGGRVIPNKHPDDYFEMTYSEACDVLEGAVIVDCDETILRAKARVRAES